MSLPAILRTCPFLIIAIASYPASVRRAVQKLPKPSPGRVSRFTFRWSCSTMLFRYFTCRSCDQRHSPPSQLQHTVEGMDGDVHLGRPALVRARAQSITDHLLEPADGSLGSSPDGVSGRFLPGRAAVLSDNLQVAVPLCGLGLSRFARHGCGNAAAR